MQDAMREIVCENGIVPWIRISIALEREDSYEYGDCHEAHGMKLRAPGKTDFERVTATADALWELARSTDVPVVALSQLRRSTTPNEPPTMDDLRQSGQIEQNANGVFLLYRPLEVEAGTKKRRYTGEDQVIIGKQRSGPAETHVPVVFDGPMGMFRPRVKS